MSLIAVGLMAAALNVHGQQLPSACGKKPLPVADAELRKIVGTLLCAPDSPVNRRLIANVLTRSARVHSDDLGEVTVSKVDMDTVLARGEAWGVKVEGTGDQVDIDYYPNEACLHSRTFERINGRWRLTKLGEACD